MDGDGLARGITLAEIIPFQHTRHSVFGGQLHQASGAEFLHPTGIEFDACPARIKDLEDLFFIGCSIPPNLFRRERFARQVLAAGIADHAGKVADEDNRLVAKLLKLAQLVDEHRVAQMQVRSRRVESRLDPQWPPLFKRSASSVSSKISSAPRRNSASASAGIDISGTPENDR